MYGMFGFLSMAGNYEYRKVARYEKDGLRVSTARVTDSAHDFETAVAHPAYNEGEIVIVEMYDTKEEAVLGHSRWVKRMTARKLPAQLKDVSTARVAEMCDILGNDSWRNKRRSRPVKNERGGAPSE